MTTTIFQPTQINSDIVRQVANVAFALSEIVATVIGYIVQVNNRFIDRSPVSTTLVTPADYAFIIWALIFATSFAYAIYQALPRNRENDLLRRIGAFTASNFLATTVWLFAAQQGSIWITVLCIVWMLVSLIGAFRQIIRTKTAFSRADYTLMILPVSIFLGWISVATVADTAAALYSSGFSNVILPNTIWAIVMLIAAGVIGSYVTAISRGNIPYALTVIWALVAIAVANFTDKNVAVIVTSLAMAIVIAFVMIRSRAGLVPTLAR